MILKNGLTLKEQMFDNYLEEVGGDSESVNVSYVSFAQCSIGRQEHVCHLNEQESHSKIDMRGRQLQRQVTHKITLIDSDEEESNKEKEVDESLEQSVKLTTAEERFR